MHLRVRPAAVQSCAAKNGATINTDFRLRYDVEVEAAQRPRNVRARPRRRGAGRPGRRGDRATAKTRRGNQRLEGDDVAAATRVSAGVDAILISTSLIGFSVQ